jgi:hypothetical protein
MRLRCGRLVGSEEEAVMESRVRGEVPGRVAGTNGLDEGVACKEALSELGEELCIGSSEWETNEAAFRLMNDSFSTEESTVFGDCCDDN